MCRKAVLAALVAMCATGAAALDLSGTWEYAFTQSASVQPKEADWRPTQIPAELTRLAGARDGYFWLRTNVTPPVGAQALILGSVLSLDAVYLDDTLLIAGASDVRGAASAVFSAQAIPLPPIRGAQASLILRIAHHGRSWVRGSPAVLPAAEAPRARLLRDLVPSHLQTAAVLALLVGIIPCLVLYRQTRSARLLYLVGAGLASCVLASIPGILSLFLSLSLLYAVANLATMTTLAFLTVFAAHGGKGMAVGWFAASALLIYGIISLGFRDLATLQRYLSVREVPLVIAVGVVGLRIARAAHDNARPAPPLVILVLLLLVDPLISFLARFTGRAGLLPTGFVSIAVALFILYVFLSQLTELRSTNVRTVDELTHRVQTGREVIQKLREGKSRLESRNLEMTRNASRLLENAQRQALTIGQIMVSIADVGTAESKVTSKEREIHTQTAETEKMITDFDRQIRSTLQGLEDLARKSETIKKAVAQIIEIADKTNMLSLNASIEATKAGAAGMGFGVVAQEIRKLADTTRNVSDHVNSVIGETNKGVANGVRMVSALGLGFGDIMTRSAAIRRMIEENSRALDEVARSHREIEDGLAGVDLTINSILEVSRDLRAMTDRVASTFSWFGEIFDLSREAEAAQGAVDVPEAADTPQDMEPAADPPAAGEAPEPIEDLEALDGPDSR